MDAFTVYYGQYPLSHWIKLLLKKEIELPPYQRNFVWSKDKVVALINSLKENLFVPPVIIGTYIEDEKTHHYIIDGQQRLSAILLTYLAKFPNKGFEGDTSKKQIADDNDDNDINDINDDNHDDVDIRNWKLTEIQKIVSNCDSYKNIDKIKNHLTEPNYISLIIDLPDDFFDNAFIGYSYIKPNRHNADTQKAYYSSIFRNINIAGMLLTPEESRSSLYWLDSKLETFFKPKQMDNILIDNNKIDFARYLAFVTDYYSNYKTSHPNVKVAKGYGTKNKPYENYIENFVYHVIGKNKVSNLKNFNEIFPDPTIIDKRIDYIYKVIQEIRNTTFTSIIDADCYLFGLIYHGLYKGEKFDNTKYNSLIKNLDEYIDSLKKDPSYIKRPSSIGRIRDRLYKSINEYEKIIVKSTFPITISSNIKIIHSDKTNG